MAHEYIYETNDPIDEILFLVRGRVSLVLKQYQDLPYLEIDEEFFGDLDFYFHTKTNNGKRVFTAKAEKDWEILVLNKNKDLLSVDDEFPEIVSELFQNTGEKVQRILQIEAEYEKKAKLYFGENQQQFYSPVKMSSMDFHSLTPLNNIEQPINHQEEDNQQFQNTFNPRSIHKLGEQVRSFLQDHQEEHSKQSSSLNSSYQPDPQKIKDEF